MRLVLDFLDLAARDADAALHLANALARELDAGADGHELWIAAPLADAEWLETLRLAFAGTSARLRPFDLPAQGAPRAALREHALAGLDPDLVLVPGADAATGNPPFPVLAFDPHTATAASLPGLLPERSVPTPSGRPRLAYVSPLPPARSGIADYSAELVEELAKVYEIDLVVDTSSHQPPVKDRRLAGIPLRSPDWLRQHAGEFERVVYHFGNSHAHQHMFALLRDVPGVVVMHDFYFSGVLDNLEREGYLPHAFMHALYESHGYTGLLQHRKEGRNPSIWAYPVNKGVLDAADGVIVHADFSKELANKWYGDGAADGWRTIPLLRGRPEGSAPLPDARAAARARLGLKNDDFLVTSFGMLGRTKLNEELLDAYLHSPLASDPRCRLVFVGENDPGLYGAGLLRTVGASSAADRIQVTGFVDAATYADYLAASDCAVQLRTSTRGETSASVLDCLLYGIPTVVNAHGSTASITDNLLLKLPDAFTREELAGALARLHAEPDLRRELSERALAHMAREHAPGHVGKLYVDAIEHFAKTGRAATYRKVVHAVAPHFHDHELPPLAAAIAFNRAPQAPRQLLVDVSAVVQSDLKTGIQRVVRSILLSMIANPPEGFRIEPVYSHGGNRSYQYARQFGMNMVGEGSNPALVMEDAPVELRPGDVFFGLDLFTNGTSQNENLLLSMRDRGVAIYFVVFDILPMLRPDVFPFGTEQYFGDFLRTVHKVSDGVLCISRAVADELAGWIASQGLTRSAPLKLGHFHLGADIDASVPSFGLPPDADQVLAALGQRPSFIMVGTVEPRKGHTQTLNAFELLWERGVDVNLVVVGKQGWMMEKLCERMSTHQEIGKRLFWMNGISDEMLLKLYDASSSLLSPSEGEGFGLPLIEAAQKGIPIIARSLPVFREVAGEHAYYFDGLAPEDLADAVTAWLELQRDGKAPQSTGMPWLTWDQSAQQVLDGLVRQQWYRTLPGTAGEAHERDA